MIAACAIEEHRDVAEEVRERYRHFVVDEYQDVNPLQQRLLDAWLGGRDDVCVVGDAAPDHLLVHRRVAAYLLDFPQRYAGATVVRLVRDYRSTPQVVGARQRACIAGDARLRLARRSAPPGPEPRSASYDDEPAEAAAVARRVAALIARRHAAREIAVLYRVNAQSEVVRSGAGRRRHPLRRARR